MTRANMNGWNSFDAYNWSVTEEEFLANAEVLDRDFKSFGYQYVVLDFIWALSGSTPYTNPNQDHALEPRLCMDQFGRLLPAPDRFPSSVPGNTLRPIADFLHGKGLKMGLHLMRGIPVQAVRENCPIKDSKYTAAQVAFRDKEHQCQWLNHMYGLDMEKSGAQDYLNSIFEQYAEWGVDFVKVDDISYPYHAAEIEGYRKAIEQCGRKMVLSLSPGPAPLEQMEHLESNADMWRISQDFWDNWNSLEEQYDIFLLWTACKREKGVPDGDMIPFSRLSLRGPAGEARYSLFTHDEKIFLMNLWCLNASPLMLGGDLTAIDDDACLILTNPEVLAVQQFAKSSRRIGPLDGIEHWTAENLSAANLRYHAFFNLTNEMLTTTFTREGSVFSNLWNKAETGICDTIRITLRPHASALFQEYL